MRNFIYVKDATTGHFMLIRKSMICSIEEDTLNEVNVRKITYIDNRPPEFVLSTLTELRSIIDD